MASLSQIPAQQSNRDEEGFSSEAPQTEPVILHDQLAPDHVEIASACVANPCGNGPRLREQPIHTRAPHSPGVNADGKHVQSSDHDQTADKVEAPTTMQSVHISNTQDEGPPSRSHPPLPEPGHRFTLENSLPDYHKIGPSGTKQTRIPRRDHRLDRLDATRLVERHAGKFSSTWMLNHLIASKKQDRRHHLNF
jgi:hypothetical protein